MRNLFSKLFFVAALLLNSASLISLQAQSNLTIFSPDFMPDSALPVKFTCDGESKAPRLSWTNVPPRTQSFVILMDDPDAPSRVWLHWLVFNLPAEMRSLDYSFTGLPTPAEAGLNDSGGTEYSAPCPPGGTHHYHFRLYALDTILKVPPKPSRALLERAMQDHILAQARLVMRYSRLR